MTHRRLNYLLLSIIAALICVLIVSHAVRAADDWDWHAGAYAVASIAADAGYDPGIGAQAEASARYKWAEGRIYGQYLRQHKDHASSGYTYSLGAQARAYVWQDLYVAGAINYAGYRSEFYNGVVWEKDGHNWGAGLGYNNGNTDLSLLYFLKEHTSPNNVQYVRAALRRHIYGPLWVLAQLTRQTWDQVVNGTTQRWAGWTGLIGVGVRW
jgi:hypothetical protein